MDRLFEQLEQCGIKTKFIEKYQGQWSPEVGAALRLFLANLGLDVSLTQLQNFLASATDQDGSELEIDPIADSDMLAIGDSAEVEAQELDSVQTIELDRAVAANRQAPNEVLLSTEAIDDLMGTKQKRPDKKIEAIGDSALMEIEELFLDQDSESIEAIGDSALIEIEELPLDQDSESIEAIGDSALMEIEELSLDQDSESIEAIGDSALVEIEELPLDQDSESIEAIGDSALMEIEELPPDQDSESIEAIGDSALMEIEELPPDQDSESIEAIGDSALAEIEDSSIDKESDDGDIGEELQKLEEIFTDSVSSEIEAEMTLPDGNDPSAIVHAVAVAADLEVSAFTNAESPEIAAEQLSASQEMVFREEIAKLSHSSEEMLAKQELEALSNSMLIPLPEESSSGDSSYRGEEYGDDSDDRHLFPTQRREKTSLLPAFSIGNTSRHSQSTDDDPDGELRRQIARMIDQADEYQRQKYFPEAIGLWAELLDLQADSSIEDKIVIAEQRLQKARQLWEDAMLLADSDKSEDARTLAEQCLEIYPHHGSAQQLLADLQRKMRQQDQRIQSIFHEGEELIFAKEFAAARSLWQNVAVNLPAESPQLEQWRGQTNHALHQAMLQQAQKYLHHKKLDQAIVLLDQATEFFPLSTDFQELWQQATTTKRHAQQLLQQAEQAVAREEFVAALAVIEQVLAIDAANQDADIQKQKIENRIAGKEQYQVLLAQGENMLATGELGGALSIWEQARKLRPGDHSIQDKINQVNARLRQIEEQHAQVDQLWAKADKARKEKQWHQALKILREIKRYDWQFQVEDPTSQIQEIETALSQQQNSQQLMQQLRLVKIALEKYQVDKARELLSQYRPDQLSGDVKELWYQYDDRCSSVAVRKNSLRKIIIIGFVLLVALLNWLLWSTDSTVARVIRLQQDIVKAVEQENWVQAHEYYRQIQQLIPVNRRHKLLAYLTREQKFAETRQQALELKSRGEWRQLSDLVKELAKLKPEHQDVKNLQTDLVRWQQSNETQTAQKLAKIETYRKQLVQEQQTLAKLWPLYRQQNKPEIDGEKLLYQLSEYLTRLEKDMATIRQSPSASLTVSPPDDAFLAKVNAGRNKIAAAVAKISDENEKQMRRYMGELSNELLVRHKQRHKLRKQIETLEKRFPTSQGYQAIPESVRDVDKQLTDGQQRLRSLIAAGNQLLQKHRNFRYVEFINAARRTTADNLQQKMPAALQSLEQIEKANKKLAAKYQQAKGIKILGNWYEDYLKNLRRYQTIMAQATGHESDDSVRDYVPKLQAKITAAQDFPRQATKIDDGLQQLQNQGMNLLKSLDKRLENAYTWTQLKQINRLKKYIHERRITVDRPEELRQLNVAVEEFHRQSMKKKITGNLLRDILTAATAIEKQYLKYRQQLDAEIINLQTMQKE